MAQLLCRAVAAVVVICVAITDASAAPVKLDRFKHFHWSAGDGAPAVTSLAQSLDGYLWIASGRGLYRFDGITFERIAAARAIADYDPVTAIASARGGGVWVGYRSHGIARFIAGRLVDMRFPKENEQVQITGIVEGRDGALWVTVGSPDHHLWRLYRGRWQPIDEQWGYPRSASSSLLVSRDGTLWITSNSALLFLPEGEHRFHRASTRPAGRAGVAEDGQGRIWNFDDSGTRLVAAPPGAKAYPTPGAPRRPVARFADDGSLWGATWGKGVFRIAAPLPEGPRRKSTDAEEIEFFGQLQGLSSDAVSDVLIDHVGNIWIGTSLGLDMFRRSDLVLDKHLAVATAFGDNLTTDTHGNVYVGQERDLLRIRPGGIPERVLHGSHISGVCSGRSGEVWVALPHGIQRVPRDGFNAIPLPLSAASYGGPYDCAIDGHGTFWLTAGRGRLYRRETTGWRQFAADSGRLSAEPIAIVDHAGRLVTQYKASLFSVIDYPRRFAVNMPGLLGVNDARTLYSGPNAILAGGDIGLFRWNTDRLRWLPATIYPWLSGIRGIVQTDAGETWLMARSGLLRLSTADLERAFARPGVPLPARLFGIDDGMPNSFVDSDPKSLVEGGDGRLWFQTIAGVAWLDPKQLTPGLMPPTVLIRALVADGLRRRDPSSTRLAAGTSAVEIDYTATNFSTPGHDQFQYRLPGVDRDWVNAGKRREAFYTNLKPGSYSFQVRAINNDDIRNLQGARLDFSIPPTFVQSWWFTSLCIAAGAALLWFAYSLRLRRVSALLRSRIEERLGERERIARELHDTLLQGVQGLILRFQTIADQLSPEHHAREMMDTALDRADEIMVEGRERVSDLRSAERGTDLQQALRDAATVVTAGTPMSVILDFEGEVREVYSITADEVLRISTEALFNAVQHAHASTVNVFVSFGRKAFEVRISDDGIGLNQRVLESGAKSGHFGLIGMRERADRIHARLILRSGPGAGTEVALLVPAAYAYVVRNSRWWRKDPLEADLEQ